MSYNDREECINMGKVFYFLLPEGQEWMQTRVGTVEEEMLLYDLCMRQLINIRALIDRKLLSYRQEATHPNV